MHRRHLTTSLAMLLTAAVLAIGGVVPALAAPQHSAAATTPAATLREVGKAILPETSIDGPALSSVFTPGSPSNRSVIAWTGTDAAHHLNVETSANGLNFGNKRILDETSPYRPDVTQMAGGPIAVAWTGDNPGHWLNVLYDVYGSPKKLTLSHDSSDAAPAVTLIGATLFLAWTGTDANHSLNILQIGLSGSSLVPEQKMVLSQFSSISGPHLARRGANSLVLLWTSPTRHLTFAFEPTVTPVRATSLPESSDAAPQTNSLLPYISSSGLEWIGWTGTDAGHHLNLQWSTEGLQFTNPAATKTVLGETAIGGPSLDYNGDLQVAWTGTDSAHHLNVAKFVYY